MARNAKLNYFPLSHGKTFSSNMGKLIPVDFVECLPGDIFRIQNEFLIRFMPTIAPVMSNFRVKLRWWYCPQRLLWEDWQDFITGGEDGTDASVEPYVTAPAETGFTVGSLAQFFRAPVGVPGIKISAKPFRMYNLIWNEMYRNQAIQDEVAISKASGADVTTSQEWLYAGWQRDLYTDNLPSPQKGPAVTLPLSASSAPVFGTGNSLRLTDGTTDFELRGDAPAGDLGLSGVTTPNPVGTTATAVTYPNSTMGVTTNKKVDSGLFADLSSAYATTINTLRQAAAIQQFQEVNMANGNRYAEFVFNMYGCKTPDASLQRPQFVGGMSSNIMISEVLQTSQSTDSSAQGTMAGHGVGAGMSPVMKFRSLEHGYLMCLMTVCPETMYFQGIPRELSRETRYDYAIPLLSHLGEQGTKNKEVYAQGTDDDEGIFGYVPRYQEYRQIPSSIAGELATSLKFWTAAREFSELPTLNSEFIEARPTNRIFAVEDANTDHLVIQVVHHMDALRPIPKHATPGLHII